MFLLEYIRRNSNLSYYDIENQCQYNFDELLSFSNLPYSAIKKTIFIYCDNSLLNLAHLFSAWAENYIIFLLSSNIDLNQKATLEFTYFPDFIFDNTRNSIQNYTFENHLFKINVFKNLHNQFDPEIKLLLSTSGSTGSPKFVKLSEKNVVENALSILEYLPISNNDNIPLNLPIQYSFGLSVLTTNSIKGGTFFINTGDILTPTFWENFEKHKFNSMAGVPYFFDMLIRIGINKFKLDSLKYLIQAGGKLSEKTNAFFMDYCTKNQILFYTMYGQTEATARMSYLPPDKLKSKQGSVGIPIKNGNFIINSETNEIEYSGPNIFGGYALSLEDLSEYKSPKYLSTGDVGYLDDDGYLFITGRLNRTAKIFGNRLNLDEIESFLEETISEIEIAVISRNDILHIFTNTPPDKYPQIIKLVSMRFKIYHQNINIQPVETIPRTQNNKIDYGKLAKITN